MPLGYDKNNPNHRPPTIFKKDGKYFVNDNSVQYKNKHKLTLEEELSYGICFGVLGIILISILRIFL